MKPIHGQHRLKDLPADAQDTPPIPCPFKVGDRVTFTNDQGCVFRGHQVRGFAPEVTTWGAFVYVFTDAWWHPVNPATLTLEA